MHCIPIRACDETLSEGWQRGQRWPSLMTAQHDPTVPTASMTAMELYTAHSTNKRELASRMQEYVPLPVCTSTYIQ